MNKFQERASDLYGLSGPWIVHCSAGVGRTGALIACHVVLEKLKRKEYPNIKNIVESLRMQRHHTMVKNEKQYEFIFKVAKDIVRDMQLSAKETMTFVSDTNRPR
jgi:protein tyrosine phosphatase